MSNQQINEYLASILWKELAKRQWSLHITPSKWISFYQKFDDNPVPPDIIGFFRRYSVFQCRKTSRDNFTITPNKCFGFCDDHIKPDRCQTPQCPNVHCCIHFLLNDCDFKSKCKHGHNLKDQHNSDVLQRNYAQLLDEREIASFLDIQRHFDNLKPLICKGYNSSSKCKFGNKCSSLHLCNYYVLGECKFKKVCERSHDLVNPEIKLALDKRYINPNQRPADILADIRELLNLNDCSTDSDDDYSTDSDDDHSPHNRGRSSGTDHRRHSSRDGSEQNVRTIANIVHKINIDGRPSGNRSGRGMEMTRSKSLSRQNSGILSSPQNDNKTNSDAGPLICTFFLRNHCLFKESCLKFHQEEKLPYQWQIEDAKDSWSNLSNNKEIEEEYCQLRGCARQQFDQRAILIDFKPMKWQYCGLRQQLFKFCTQEWNGRIRRLTTETQTDATKAYYYLTFWNWFWQDQVDIWLAFEEGDGYPSSEKIEAAFQADPNKPYKYNTDNWVYEIQFDRMLQKNTTTGKIREILRRPDRFDEKLKKPRSIAKEMGDGGGSLGLRCPSTWDNEPEDGKLFHLFEVSRSGITANEFSKVERVFMKTLTQPIKSLKRIQNKELWTFFKLTHLTLTKKGPSSGRIMSLFHGTKAEYLNAICQQGFDFRLSGTTTGTLFGKGSYFARDASYSASYTNSKKMFVATVIVGEYALGQPTYCRPPTRDQATNSMYESCVNNGTDPSIFVVFDNHQAYPQYIIEY